jgi:hypothetical protein
MNPPNPPAPNPAPLLPLDEAQAQAWRLLERRLRQIRGFGLLIYFVRTPLLALRLRTSLDAHLAAQNRRLITTAAPHPENFADITLKSLLGSVEPENAGAHWLEAHKGASQTEWDTQRRELLLRLNERRSRLESEFHAPLILLLPAGWAADMACLAPDLWHIRLLSSELAASIPPGQPMPATAELRNLQSIEDPVGLQVEPEVSGALQYWLDQWHATFDDLSSQDIKPDHPNLWSLSIWDGDQAIKACLKYGRFAQAEQVAQDILKISRIRMASVLDEEKYLALRDWAEAEKAYRESLAISRELVERLGGTPESLDDLAIALMNNAGLPNAPAQELLAEAATIYASLVQQCPQVRRYADILGWVRDKLAAASTPSVPDPSTDPT